MPVKPLTVVILHGTLSNPDSNWFPWLRSELLRQGYVVHVPRLPTPDKQSPENWKEQMRQEFVTIDTRTILVGHSMGAGFAMWLLSSLARPLAATFLVCPFFGPIGNEEYDALNAPFFKRPYDWSRIPRYSGFTRVYAGDNDPYVPLAMSQDVADKLKKKLTIIPDGGHLNAESGFTTFPRLLKDITSDVPNLF